MKVLRLGHGNAKIEITKFQKKNGEMTCTKEEIMNSVKEFYGQSGSKNKGPLTLTRTIILKTLFKGQSKMKNNRTSGEIEVVIDEINLYRLTLK